MFLLLLENMEVQFEMIARILLGSHYRQIPKSERRLHEKHRVKATLEDFTLPTQ